MSSLHVILVSPDIPQNTGNIARTCAVTGSRLSLIRPISFTLSTKQVKRAGLDYWDDVEIAVNDTLEEAVDGPLYFFSTKGTTLYTEARYEPNACLIFGSESRGLPLWIHEKWRDRFYTIPMMPTARSLNVANAVSITLYEALRQQAFPFSPLRRHRQSSYEGR